MLKSSAAGNLLDQALAHRPPLLHVVRERDVGLFSLIQQVIANIPWALGEGRVPVVDFRHRTCYWNEAGHRGGTSVWEYYFEPLVPEFSASVIGVELRALIEEQFPDQDSPGRFVSPNAFVTNNYGEHSSLAGKALRIPYETGNPDPELRATTSVLISDFIRPRSYLKEKAELFYNKVMDGEEVIGVHVRGTDAVSPQETREYRRGSLDLDRYERTLSSLLRTHPRARFFVATDAEASLVRLRATFGDRILAYDSVRHRDGEPAGAGPTGRIMPAYIASDSGLAAQNGEDAVVEYLLLSRCSHLVHNGAGLAMTVLLANPTLPHINTHNRRVN